MRRIYSPEAIPLVAGEHTAQMTANARTELEDHFKAPPGESPVNILACSPTLEMGIDVGGLDAVIMRNVPPRPDNYAQRGGRAGRRSRVGLVLGYARSTPHDQYFYDKPREMISGEIPAPALSLGNRDVLVRHLYAIACGAAHPGLAGRMVDYVSPDGQIKDEAVTALLDGIRAQSAYAVAVAREAWGTDILGPAGVDEAQLRQYIDALPDRIRHVIDRTARQVIELRQALDTYAQSLEGRYAGMRAGELVARLLGLQSDTRRPQREADDRSGGYPLRRLAEFGLLPGYEFPSEPAALRLFGDEHEEDPITVTRRFGIGQFQPDAHVYARGRRWKVIGLDRSSPWNPQSEAPTWSYRLCDPVRSAMTPTNRAARAAAPSVPAPPAGLRVCRLPGQARRTPDPRRRRALRGPQPRAVYPQWNGEVVGRWTVGTGWALRLSRNEEVRWVNEGLPPSGDRSPVAPAGERLALVSHVWPHARTACPGSATTWRAAQRGPPWRRAAEWWARRRLSAPGEQSPAGRHRHRRACRSLTAAGTCAPRARARPEPLLGPVTRLRPTQRHATSLYARYQ